jgi:MFS family permease
MAPTAGRFVALKHRDYRLLWSGNFISVIGNQMQFVAINWHVYQLLQGASLTITLFGRPITLGVEALGLGGVGLARIIPIAIFALLGGTLADTQDRRKMLLWTNSAAAVFAGILAYITFAGRDTVPAIYLLTAAGAAVAALMSPAYQSLIPNLVPSDELTNAVSLNTLMFQVATITGPAAAGVVMAKTTVGWVYALNALSFLVIVVSLLAMHYRGKAAAKNTGLGWAAIVEGWRYVRNTKIIWGSMMLDFLATFFSSARTMLPLVAGDILKVGASGYGLLSTSQAVGSVIAGLVMSLRKDIHKQGAVLLGSVVIYGATTALFGLSVSFVLSYLLFALSGAADTVSTVIRATLRQIMTPDRLRGRMTGINMLFTFAPTHIRQYCP